MTHFPYHFINIIRMILTYIIITTNNYNGIPKGLFNKVDDVLPIRISDFINKLIKFEFFISNNLKTEL